MPDAPDALLLRLNAAPASSKKLEDVILDLETASAGNFCEYALQIEADFDAFDRAAFLADHVMMVTIVRNKLVALHAIQKIDFGHNSLLFEEIQLPIEAGFIGAQLRSAERCANISD